MVRWISPVNISILRYPGGSLDQSSQHLEYEYEYRCTEYEYDYPDEHRVAAVSNNSGYLMFGINLKDLRSQFVDQHFP